MSAGDKGNDNVFNSLPSNSSGGHNEKYRLMKCKLCGKTFKTRADFDDHINSQHKFCEKCKRGRCQSLLEKTCRRCQLERPRGMGQKFQCEKCFTWFSVKNFFDYHVLKECPYLKQAVLKTVVPLATQRKGKLVQKGDLPKVEVKLQTPKPEVCKKPPKLVNKIVATNRKSPLKCSKSSQRKEIFKCGSCGQRFIFEANLQKHECPIPIKKEPLDDVDPLDIRRVKTEPIYYEDTILEDKIKSELK